MEEIMSFAAAWAGGGCQYASVAAAQTNQQIKATAGVLKSLFIAGTGTAGTVAIIDNATTIFTFGVPAAVTGIGIPIPPEGITIGNLKITTAGTGVTALVGFM